MKFAVLWRSEWGSATLREQQVNERHPMNDTQTNELTQQWIEVSDADGRTHLESRWIAMPATAPVHITSAA